MKNKLSLSLLLILSITFFSNSFSAIFTWTGTASTAWNDAQNWTNNSVPTSYDDILININSVNDLILDQDKVIGNIQLLSSSSRKIVLGNYNLTANSLTGFSSTCYVKTSGTGSLVMALANNTSNVYPIGNSAYNPLTITNKSGASDVFSARVIDGAYMEGLTGAAITSTVLNRTWDISKTNVNGGSGVDFIFNWNAGEVANGSFTTPKMNHYSSTTSNWEVPTVTSTVVGSDGLTVVGYTGTFSPFTVAEGSSALPVELTSFNANCTENATTINWQTASEHNSAYFDIEKSRDGATWNVIKTVNAAGNSTSTIDYSTIDSEKAMDVVYYRLNQVDIDGASKIYGPISVSCDETIDFTATIFPNPTAKDFSVSFLNSEAQNFDIQLIGTDGKVVYQTTRLVEAGSTILPFSSENLNAGVYSLHVKGENTLKTIKLVVQ
jgi:hypothetical protein